MTRNRFCSNHRLIVGRVHVKMQGLPRPNPAQLQFYDETKSTDSDRTFLPNVEMPPTRMRLLISKTMIKLRQKSKVVINAGAYCMNTFRYCIGYTFCCIIVKKKKHPGIIRSVRI